MANINDFKDKVDDYELARMTRELESSVRHIETLPTQRKSSFEFLKSPPTSNAGEDSSTLPQSTHSIERQDLRYGDVAREEDEQEYLDRRESWMKDLALDVAPENDTSNWFSEAHTDETEANSDPQYTGIEKSPLTKKISDLRSGRESVENNLEAEAYTAEALRTVIDAQNASRPVDNTPSDVEGITQSELEALQKEARNTFAPAVKRQPAVQPISSEPTYEELNRAVPLHPSKVGINALLKDIEKSEMDPSKGIRDFYNKAYSEHVDLRVREKEQYLNLPITGDVAKARQGLSKFDELNGFNSSALDTLNDGMISAMRDLHKEEREKEPQNKELVKRHAAEEALFNFREASEKFQDSTPQNLQSRRDSLKEVLASHTKYAEQRWGRQLDIKDRPSVNDELQKFDLKISAAKAPTQTILQDVKLAQEIQRSKLQMKISKFR